jgi:lysozyme
MIFEFGPFIRFNGWHKRMVGFPRKVNQQTIGIIFGADQSIYGYFRESKRIILLLVVVKCLKTAGSPVWPNRRRAQTTMLNRLFIIPVLCAWLFACEQDTVRRTDFSVEGVDVSHYQARIDWSQVREQGMDFAFVKATEGATHADTLFCDNWEDIRAAGLMRGAYHFFRPRTSAEAQAFQFMHWVDLQPGDLPPVLDVEVLDGVAPPLVLDGLRTWLWLAELHYGVKPILYTNLKFYNRYLAGHFNEYPLWIARYNEREPVLADGDQWLFWQYGNRGSLPGVAGFVDFNVFAGDSVALEELGIPAQAVLSGRWD